MRLTWDDLDGQIKHIQRYKFSVSPKTPMAVARSIDQDREQMNEGQGEGGGSASITYAVFRTLRGVGQKVEA